MNATPWIEKVDAYLLWGIHTRFRHLQPLEAGPDGAGIGLLARKETDGGRIQTKIASPEALVDDPDATLAGFDRVELANPVALSHEQKVQVNVLDLSDPVVLGAIDDGFPFAQRQWAARLQRLWDQNGPRTVNEQGDVIAPGYGRLWTNTELAMLVQAQAGTGLPEDTGAYREAHMHSLRRRATHGAHVMDLLGGERPPRARISASRETLEPGNDGSATEAPVWNAPTDAASAAPMLCVQLPRAAVDDPTGRWLGLHALDGLDFIIGTIGTKIVPGQTVIVNLSWGPQTGPHDGSSLLEQALQQRVLDQLGLNRMLLIALPAGNSYAARAHAQFAANEGCEELIWRVPPGHRAPSFLEFWWPAGTDPTDARLEVLAPDGLEFGLGVDDGNSAFVEPGSSASLTRVVHAERPMVLLALAPTDGAEHRAPHGAWRIRVLPVAGGAPDPVHVYVARQSANMGARRRGPDSHLFDPRYEQERQHALFPGEVADSRVRREGTLNGLATGALTVVTGGSVLNRSHLGGDRAMAPYSSSGPGSGPGGRNPNVAAACDESPLLRGLRASGVRPGTSVRLVGTSVAAPQVGRKLARLVSGESSIDAPAPTVPANPRRAGAGILTPMNLPGVPEPHAAGASWQDALSSWLADTPTTP